MNTENLEIYVSELEEKIIQLNQLVESKESELKFHKEKYWVYKRLYENQTEYDCDCDCDCDN